MRGCVCGAARLLGVVGDAVAAGAAHEVGADAEGAVAVGFARLDVATLFGAGEHAAVLAVAQALGNGGATAAGPGCPVAGGGAAALVEGGAAAGATRLLRARGEGSSGGRGLGGEARLRGAA